MPGDFRVIATGTCSTESAIDACGEALFTIRRLAQLELLGRTRRERLMLEATDEYLAQAPASADPVKLKESTKKKILAMWKKTV